MTNLLQHEVFALSAERAREISALGPWFHNLHLPDGSLTAPNHPLGDFPRFKWEQIAPHVPRDLSGWSALDIGCNAGFYSIELAKRGAHVLGIDVEPLFLRQAEWASHEWGLEGALHFEQMQVYDLRRRRESFDLVLFMGVFYHLRYPMLALDIVSSCVRRLMVFQTLTMPGDEVSTSTAVDRDVMDRADFLTPGWPKIAFIEHAFAGDSTNWWAPNHAAAEAMLRSSGMRVLARPAHEIYLCEPRSGSETWARTPRGAEELASATGEGGERVAPEESR
jgi:tRNA (mo5U34)-methyltransferase